MFFFIRKNKTKKTCVLFILLAPPVPTNNLANLLWLVIFSQTSIVIYAKRMFGQRKWMTPQIVNPGSRFIKLKDSKDHYQFHCRMRNYCTIGPDIFSTTQCTPCSHSETTTERFNPTLKICFRQPHGFIITTRCAIVIVVVPLPGGIIFGLFKRWTKATEFQTN